jgi:hypothetical protein
LASSCPPTSQNGSYAPGEGCCSWTASNIAHG